MGALGTRCGSRGNRLSLSPNDWCDQAKDFCGMNATTCLANIDIKSFKCQVSCKGSYALIEFVEEKEDKKELAPIMAA